MFEASQNIFRFDYKWALSTVVVVAGVACSSPQKPNEPEPSSTEVSDSQIQEIKEEIAIGRTMASKMLGTYGLLEKRERMQKYVSLVGASIARQFGRSELKYYFSVLDDEEANAFATPGGYIFVTRGLLKILKDESELAAVLAHELVHVNHKHMYLRVRTKREVSTGETISKVLSRGAGDIGRGIAQAVNAGMKTLLEEGLTQANEFDADGTAVVYLAALGYDTQSLSRVLNRLAAHKGKTIFQKTHPPFSERITTLTTVIQKENLANKPRVELIVTQNRFDSAKKGL